MRKNRNPLPGYAFGLLVWAKHFCENVDDRRFSENERGLFDFLVQAIDDFEAEMPMTPDGAFYTEDVAREARRKTFDLQGGNRP
jgi:hypothetical protein